MGTIAEPRLEVFRRAAHGCDRTDATVTEVLPSAHGRLTYTIVVDGRTVPGGDRPGRDNLDRLPYRWELC